MDSAPRTGWFEATFALAPIGAAAVDADARIAACNRVLATLLGADENELVGESLIDWSHPDDRARIREVLDDLTSGARVAIEADQRFVDARTGDTRWTRTHAWLSPTGSGDLAIWLVDDVSETHAATETLQPQAELGRLTAVVAHDMKNPLAGVIGALDIIGAQLSDTPALAVLDEAEARLRSLVTTAEDLLLFTRPCVPCVAPVEVADLVRECARGCRGPDRITTLPPQDESAHYVEGDERLLRRLFEAVLEEATRAAPAPAPISIEVATVADGVRIAVTHPGKHDESCEPRLGLALARRIATAHGGAVGVIEEHAGGTTIRCDLRGRATA